MAVRKFGDTPIGVIHREDPGEALKILRKAVQDGAGDDARIGAILGISRFSVRRYRRLYPELRELGSKARVKEAREALASGDRSPKQ